MKELTNRSSKRNEDERKTEIVNQFLDKYVYRYIFGFDNINRINDKDKQVKGVDIEFDYNGFHYICDEKASTDEKYIKSYLPTFCLELSMINQIGELNVGWFVNSNLLTNSYCLVWVDKAKNCNINSIDDIIEAEVIIVRKSKLNEYFTSKGWTTNTLKKKAENIRLNANKNENMGNFKTNGIKFSFSEYLPEKPVNVLLKRETYRELSDYRKIINTEEQAYGN